MTATPAPAHPVWRLAAARTAPPEVLLFGLFAVQAIASDVIIVVFRPAVLVEHVVPVTGSLASLPYLFSVQFAAMLIFMDYRPLRLRLALVFMIVFCAGINLVQWLALPGDPGHVNPYLRVNPWRLAWTVAVPLAWAVALLLPLAFRRGVRRAVPDSDPDHDE